MRVLVEAEVRQLRESYDVQRGSAMVVALCDSWLAQRDVVAAAQEVIYCGDRIVALGDYWSERRASALRELARSVTRLGLAVPEAEETPQ